MSSVLGSQTEGFPDSCPSSSQWWRKIGHVLSLSTQGRNLNKKQLYHDSPAGWETWVANSHGLTIWSEVNVWSCYCHVNITIASCLYASDYAFHWLYLKLLPQNLSFHTKRRRSLQYSYLYAKGKYRAPGRNYDVFNKCNIKVQNRKLAGTSRFPFRPR